MRRPAASQNSPPHRPSAPRVPPAAPPAAMPAGSACATAARPPGHRRHCCPCRRAPRCVGRRAGRNVRPEFLAERFAPLAGQRIVVLCGKGNNGGDGLVVARQLHTRFQPASLQVVLLAEPAELKGDAAANFAMLLAAASPFSSAGSASST